MGKENSQKGPYRVRVDSFRGKKVRCITNIEGSIWPIAFPRDLIKHYALIEGDEFDWYPSREGEVRYEDCVPIRDLPPTKEEIKELDRFVREGLPMKYFLDQKD